MSPPNRIIFACNRKEKTSSNRGRTPSFLRMTPVDAGEQIAQLGRRDRHCALCRRRPQKAPLLKSFREQHAPCPSCQITFNRPPRRPRKQNRCPPKGSRCKTSCTNKDRLANPLRISVCPVASQTRTPVGIGIIAAPRRPRHGAKSLPPRPY